MSYQDMLAEQEREYNEEKAKVEKFFKRPLSDREFAEVLLGKIEWMKSEVEGIASQYEDAVINIKDSIGELKRIKEWAE